MHLKQNAFQSDERLYSFEIHAISLFSLSLRNIAARRFKLFRTLSITCIYMKTNISYPLLPQQNNPQFAFWCLSIPTIHTLVSRLVLRLPKSDEWWRRGGGIESEFLWFSQKNLLFQKQIGGTRPQKDLATKQKQSKNKVTPEIKDEF